MDGSQNVGRWHFNCPHWSYFILAVILVAVCATFSMVLLPHFLRDEYTVKVLVMLRYFSRCIICFAYAVIAMNTL